METIFDFRPSSKELVALFGYNNKEGSLQAGVTKMVISINEYESNLSDDVKAFDVAKLLESRGENSAKEYWALIPELEQQYRWDDNAENVEFDL